MTETRNGSFHLKFLKDELERRKEKNSRYSLRAFAKQLGIHASALCRVINGGQEISTKMAMEILKHLRMTEIEKRLFLTSISEEKRTRASQSLERAIGLEAHAGRSAMFQAEGEVCVVASSLRELTQTKFAESQHTNASRSIDGTGVSMSHAQGVTAMRYRKLSKLIGNLSSVKTRAEIATRFIRDIIDAAGASDGTILVMSESGYDLEPIPAFPRAGHEFASTALRADTPVSMAARLQIPVWMENVGQKVMILGNHHPEPELALRRASALPLVNQGSTVGVLNLELGARADFDENEKTFLMAIAELCAHILAETLEREGRTLRPSVMQRLVISSHPMN